MFIGSPNDNFGALGQVPGVPTKICVHGDVTFDCNLRTPLKIAGEESLNI